MLPHRKHSPIWSGHLPAARRLKTSKNDTVPVLEGSTGTDSGVALFGITGDLPLLCRGHFALGVWTCREGETMPTLYCEPEACSRHLATAWQMPWEVTVAPEMASTS